MSLSAALSRILQREVEGREAQVRWQGEVEGREPQVCWQGEVEGREAHVRWQGELYERDAKARQCRCEYAPAPRWNYACQRSGYRFRF